MKRILLLSAIVLMVPLALIGQKDISKTFTGVKSIRMTTASGDCKFVKATDGKVTVKIRHNYDEKVFEPTFEQSGDRLEIRERYNSNSVSGPSAQWTVIVPEELRIRFSTGSGNIEAADMKLNLDINTGSGDLIFRMVGGMLNGNTGSGDLELDGFDGELDINIGSGTANVNNGKGELDLNCGSGDIRLSNCNGKFSANTGSGNVRGRGLTLAGSSRFNSGSGDSEVILAAAPKFDITVNSGSGDAEINFSGNEIVGEITMEANKRGGRIEAPFEFDHTEEIDNGGSTTVRKTVVKGSATPKIHVGTGSGVAAIRK